jgi:hypothetical protein
MVGLFSSAKVGYVIVEIFCKCLFMNEIYPYWFNLGTPARIGSPRAIT